MACHVPLAVRRWLLAALFAVLVLTAAPAQCNFQTVAGGMFGANGYVNASLLWDPDGTGPTPKRLVLGGMFTAIGTVATRGIAAFDPVAGTWSTFGAGLDTNVSALAVLPNGDLVAAGDFLFPGLHIARWNGTAWVPLGGGLVDLTYTFGTQVRALAVLPNGDLVAGGVFTSAGGVAVRSIARWNGTTWQAMGSGVGYPWGHGIVHCLAVQPNGDLLVGGEFTDAGGVPAPGLAVWNGAWSGFAAPPGLAPKASAISVAPNGVLVVSWQGVTPEGVYRWNGSGWTLLGAALPPAGGYVAPDIVCLLALSSTEIYAGGLLGSIGGVPVNGVARWHGTGWYPLGSGLSVPGANTLTKLDNGLLVVGGNIQTAGGVAAPNLAFWDGQAWSNSPALGANNTVQCAIVEPDGSVVIGGWFTTVGTLGANRIARWNGASWQAFGTGLGGPSPYLPLETRALARMPNGTIVAAGLFTLAGGVPVNNIARWNSSVWAPLGNGLLGPVEALAVLPNGDLIAGGSFSNGGGQTSVARWDGTAWSALGPGFSNPVAALAVLADGSLVAGGLIWEGVRRWDGTSWGSLGGGVFAANSGSVSALAVMPDGSLVVTGNFAAMAGTSSPNAARWNGTTWSGLGSGLAVADIPTSMTALPNGDLVACSPSRLMRWNGATWTTLANLGSPRTVAVQANGTLFVGGSFTTVNGIASNHLARCVPTCPAQALASGGGCTGPSGPLVLGATTLPWLGGTLRTVCSGFGAGDLGVAMLGVTPMALPLASIHPTGGPGCSLLASGDVLRLLLPSGGTAEWQLPIPMATSLVGAQFAHQVLQVTLDPQQQMNGMFSSNALQLLIGAL